jgi:type IV secretory pathway VirB2 component (pilin)
MKDEAMTQNMTPAAMHAMMSCGSGGWLATGIHVVGLVVLLLAGAALVKYLFFGDRRNIAA